MRAGGIKAVEATSWARAGTAAAGIQLSARARAGSGARALPPLQPLQPLLPPPLPPPLHSARSGAGSVDSRPLLDEEDDYVMIDGPSPFSSGQHLRCIALGIAPFCMSALQLL